MKRLAVLASGQGSNLSALIRARLPIGVVIVNRPEARAAERAREAGIEALLIDHTQFADRADFDHALADALQARQIDYVVLAGFMRIIGAPVLDAFPNRVVNVHPALLPSFTGLHAQRQALAAGVKISGCTVHLVDGGVDTGPILAQAAVPVLEGDTEESLSKRILIEEHRLLPAVASALIRGGVQVKGRVATLGAPLTFAAD